MTGVHLVDQGDRAATDPAGGPTSATVFAHSGDHARLFDLVKRARDERDPGLLVVGDQRNVWIARAFSRSACFHCFELWRYDSKLLDRPVASPDPDDLHWVRLPGAVQGFVDMAVATYPRVDDDSEAVIRHCDLAARTVGDHRLLRHPLCRICEAEGAFISPTPTADAFRDAGQPADSRVLDLTRLQQMVREKVVDTEHGIVRSLTRQAGSRIIPVASANGYSFGGRASATWSFGRTGDCDTDWTVACLEAVERLAGMKPGCGAQWVRASYTEIADRAVDPRALILPEPPAPDDRPSAFRAYSPTTQYDWCEGFSIGRAKPVLVPLQAAYYGMDRNAIAGGVFLEENSNGCALGGSILEATFYGLLELLERDAFLRPYYADAVVPASPAGAFSDPFIDAISTRIRAAGYAVDFLHLSTGTMAHAVAARIRKDANVPGPSLAFAAGAHLSPVRAARSAVCEVASNIYDFSTETVAENNRRGLELLGSPQDVRTLEDHGLQGWPKEALDLRDFRTRPCDRPIASPAEVSLSEAFSSITDALAAEGIDVIVVNQSHPGLVEEGLHCVKVLAPGLLPMTFGYHRRRATASALTRLPLEDARISDPANVRPHPFQ